MYYWIEITSEGNQPSNQPPVGSLKGKRSISSATGAWWFQSFHPFRVGTQESPAPLSSKADRTPHKSGEDLDQVMGHSKHIEMIPSDSRIAGMEMNSWLSLA